MRTLKTLLAACLLAPSAHAQTASTSTPASASTARTSSASTSSRSALSSGLTVITTTILSTPTSAPSGSSTSISSYVLTLTLNSTDLSSYSQGTNSSSNTTLTTNSTLSTNASSNATVAWNDTDSYLPFHIVIDPAYGTLGGVLILTGIPVAVLGGKNRWSSLAIASGYGLMLFTLVMILRFGVEPNLQPPSPNPPSTTLRGLYLLACLIASFFGAALGIFMYKFAQYWVSAAGGFAFGWYLLATRPGGLIHSVLGRWGLLGGLTVGGLIASLPKVLNPHMTLISTAWIGATAFTLGVDCYTRAGLKEFYIYNLGFHDLFPALNGGKYPLTQTMEIELGILAAVVLIGAAIQFRVLNILQKRLKQIREEEEARIEAEEIEKAAERFKNVGAELNEWEEKHGPSGTGNGGGSLSSTMDGNPFGSGSASIIRADRSSVALPQLGFEDGREREFPRDGRPSSTLSLLRNVDHRGSYDAVGASSPPLPGPDTPTSTMFIGIGGLKSSDDAARSASSVSSDPELEGKLKLLAEVKKAREEVRGSLDKLRATTPTPTVLSDNAPLGVGRTTTPTPTLGGLSDGARSRPMSTTSSRILEYTPQERAKPESSPSQGDWDTYLAERKLFTPPATAFANTLSSGGSGYANSAQDRRQKTTSMLEPRVSDWGPREELGGMGTYPPQILAPNQQYTPRERIGSDRPATYHDYFNQTPPFNLGTPIIIGSAASARPRPSSQAFPQQRAMTYDELAERHRKRLSKLQDPVTARMREEVDLAEAKAKWERQQRLDRNAERKREADKVNGAVVGSPGVVSGEKDRGKGRQEVLQSTDQWRRSVLSPPPPAATPRGPQRSRSSTQFAS